VDKKKGIDADFSSSTSLFSANHSTDCNTVTIIIHHLGLVQ
jgi:hypothetical protein